jgi:hypothetical protein
MSSNSGRLTGTQRALHASYKNRLGAVLATALVAYALFFTTFFAKFFVLGILLFVITLIGTLFALGTPARIAADAEKASRLVLCTSPSQVCCEFKLEQTSCSPRGSTYAWFVKFGDDQTALEGKSFHIDYPDQARLKELIGRQITCKIHRNEQEPWYIVVDVEGTLIIARDRSDRNSLTEIDALN